MITLKNNKNLYTLNTDVKKISIKIILKKNINKKIILFIINFIKLLSNQNPIFKKNNIINVNIKKKNFNIFIYNFFSILSKKLNLKLNKFNINYFIKTNIYKYILIIDYMSIKLYFNIYIIFNNNILLLNVNTLKFLGFKF